MNSVYLDTNIFIYLSDKTSPFYKTVFSLIKTLKHMKVPLNTSTETIQEIIHFSQNIKLLQVGIKTAKNTLELLDNLVIIDKETVNIYLDLVTRHKNIKSRDSLHAAACINNKIKTIITYDKDFKKFKEVSSLTPGEFLKKNRV